MSDLAEIRAATAEMREAAAEMREAAREASRAAVERLIAPHRLIPYGTFIKSIGLSYDLAAEARRAGKLKAVEVGSKLFVRAGHAEEFARSLPLAKPAPKRRRR